MKEYENKLSNKGEKYMKEINSILNKIKELKEQKGNDELTIFEKNNKLKEMYKKDKELYIQEIVKNQEKEQFNKEIDFKIACYKNNLDILIADKIKNIVLNILNKYNNKQYGKKTKEKIYNEVYEQVENETVFSKHSFSFGISNNEITIYSYSFENVIYSNNNLILKYNNYNNNFINNDNKISLYNDEINLVYHPKYILNIDKYIKEKKESFEKIKKLNDELTKEITVYRENKIDYLQEIYNKNNIYKSIEQ